jgi:hypothetical protein
MEMGKKIKLQLEEKNKYVGNSGLNGSGGSNCGGVDNQSDPYVRKSDLKEELKDFVRKSDLKEALSNFVTKSELREELNLLKTDLKEELKDFVRKEDLKNFVTKDELNQLETNLRKDMATKDELNKLSIRMDNGFNELKQLILAKH